MLSEVWQFCFASSYQSILKSPYTEQLKTDPLTSEKKNSFLTLT